MKPLAIFDLDGTLFRWQLYHELVFALKERGFFTDSVADQLESSLIDWQAKRSSWHDYEMAVVRALEPELARLDTKLFDEAVGSVIKSRGHKIYSYTKRLLDSCRRDGYFTLAISGSQQEVAEAFASQYGFDDCIGALYERSEKGFTGKVARRVPGRKHEIIHEYLKARSDLSLEGSLAIGDSDGDITMLEMVEQPIAFNPSRELLDIALDRGWQIVLERKNIAYTLKDNNGNTVLAKTDTY